MAKVKGTSMPKTHSSADPKKPASQGSNKGAPTQSPSSAAKPTGGRGATGKVNKQNYGGAPKPTGGSGSGFHKGDSLPR